MGKECCRKNRKVKETRGSPHVKVSSKVDEMSICGEKPRVEDSSVTFTRSEERYRQFMNDSDIVRNDKVMRKNGWCNSEGVPWGSNFMPKDEAALLKKGLVDRTGARVAHMPLDHKFYDEVELLKAGLVDKKGRQAVNEGTLVTSTHPMSSYPITVAELNSRGFIDNDGKLHYCLQSLAQLALPSLARSPRVTVRDNRPSITSASDMNVTLNSSLAESETKVSFSPNRPIIERKRSSTATSIGSTGSATGTIKCAAGPPNDRAAITYTVTRDGRNYEMNTECGHDVHLEFNKKHAYLTVD